ncbi:MAG: hypothetical protein QOG60_1521, partial [Frankiaceae bacterium]|nr:hypothetical protein [Frankiaceae bacterium]
FGFGAVRQLFEPLLHDAARRDELLRGSAAASAPVFDLVVGEPGPAEESSFATLHGLYWLTVNLSAAGPLVLVVDDLHWCDVGSLRFLTYLVRRLEGLPVLLVAARRTGEEPVDAALVEELGADIAAVPIRLGPLSAAGLRSIIASRLGSEPDPAFTAACLETSSGNPLLLRQLLRALQSDGLRPDAAHADTARALGSRAIGSMVRLRLHRLTASALLVAQALAVLGDGAALPVVAALAGLDEADAAQATAALVRAEVLRPESPLGFVHALVRSAVLAGLAPGERELLHDRAARLLHRAGASSEQVAAQLLAAPARADGWAVDMLRTAAAEALRRGVPDSATSYLRRAMAEPPPPSERPDLLLELARAEVSVDGPAALTHLREAYATLQDPGRRAFAALALARTMVFVAPRGEAAAFARDARASLPDELVDERQGLLALCRISVHMHGLDADAWGLAAAGHPVPEIVGDGPGARMLAAQLAWEYLSMVESDEAVRLARWALDGGVLYAVDNGLLWVVATMVQDLADGDVMPLWDEAIALAHARGSLFSVLSVSLWRGYSLFRRGDLPEAEVSLGVAVDQLKMWQAPGTGAAYAESQQLQALLEMDRLAEARARFGTVGPAMPGSDGERLLLEAEAEILLAEGRPAQAVPLLQRAGTLLPQMCNPAWRRGPALLADAYAAMGRTENALALLDGQLELARRWGAPGTVGPLLRRHGALLLLRDEEAGLAELTEAERLLASGGLRVEHGKALLALGAALLARPVERALAVGLLLQAVEVAEGTSAARLRRGATEALAEAGVAVPALRRAGLAGLSTTRRRIALLAADGVSLREIAESLYLTPRAVEKH